MTQDAWHQQNMHNFKNVIYLLLLPIHNLKYFISSIPSVQTQFVPSPLSIKQLSIPSQSTCISNPIKSLVIYPIIILRKFYVLLQSLLLLPLFTLISTLEIHCISFLLLLSQIFTNFHLWLKIMQNLFSYSSQSQQSKVDPTGLKSRCQQNCVSFAVCRGESMPLPFPAYRSCLVLLPTSKPAIACWFFLMLHHSDIESPITLLRIQCTNPDNSGKSPHHKISWLATIIPSATSNFPFHVTHSQVLMIRMWTSLGVGMGSFCLLQVVNQGLSEYRSYGQTMLNTVSKELVLTNWVLLLSLLLSLS